MTRLSLDILRSDDFLAVANRIESVVLPSLRLVPVPQEGRTDAPGVPWSRLGGAPALPSAINWPEREGRPLAFIAQLNLSELWRDEIADQLPDHGVLYFFYDVGRQPWGFDPADRDAWRVTYVDVPVGLTEPSEFPRSLHDDARFRSVQLKAILEWTLPQEDSQQLQLLQLPDDQLERYWAVLDELRARRVRGPMHRLLGHPDMLQGDMQLKCQLASNGVYVGNESGYQSDDAMRLSEGAADWHLLLQVDSDEEKTGMQWGDGGRIYFWIQEKDLKKLDFGAVWLALQTA